MEFYFVLIRLVFWQNADLHAIVYPFWVSQVALLIKNSPVSAGEVRHGFNPWVGKIPWGRAQQTTPAFFPGESPGQRSLVEHTVHRITSSETWLFSTSVTLFLFCSVLFSRSVVSNSLRPHEPQHARPPCPSPAPRVHPNPCPLSQWCHPTVSSSAVPFSFCPQSFPASSNESAFCIR